MPTSKRQREEESGSPEPSKRQATQVGVDPGLYESIDPRLLEGYVPAASGAGTDNPAGDPVSSSLHSNPAADADAGEGNAAEGPASTPLTFDHATIDFGTFPQQMPGSSLSAGIPAPPLAPAHPAPAVVVANPPPGPVAAPGTTATFPANPLTTTAVNNSIFPDFPTAAHVIHPADLNPAAIMERFPNHLEVPDIMVMFCRAPGAQSGGHNIRRMVEFLLRHRLGPALWHADDQTRYDNLHRWVMRMRERAGKRRRDQARGH